ncbi:hypothetical protein SAFG77S_03947 [Streptomyces afghaniensis]
MHAPDLLSTPDRVGNVTPVNGCEGTGIRSSGEFEFTFGITALTPLHAG